LLVPGCSVFVPVLPYCSNEGKGVVMRFVKLEGLRCPKGLKAMVSQRVWMSMRKGFAPGVGLLCFFPKLCVRESVGVLRGCVCWG